MGPDLKHLNRAPQVLKHLVALLKRLHLSLKAGYIFVGFCLVDPRVCHQRLIKSLLSVQVSAELLLDHGLYF